MENVKPDGAEAAIGTHTEAEAEEKKDEHKDFEDAGPDDQLVQLVLYERCQQFLNTYQYHLCFVRYVQVF